MTYHDHCLLVSWLYGGEGVSIDNSFSTCHWKFWNSGQFDWNPYIKSSMFEVTFYLAYTLAVPCQSFSLNTPLYLLFKQHWSRITFVCTRVFVFSCWFKISESSASLASPRYVMLVVKHFNLWLASFPVNNSSSLKCVVCLFNVSDTLLTVVVYIIFIIYAVWLCVMC